MCTTLLVDKEDISVLKSAIDNKLYDLDAIKRAFGLIPNQKEYVAKAKELKKKLEKAESTLDNMKLMSK